MGLIADASNHWDFFGIVLTAVLGPTILVYINRLDKRNSKQHERAQGERGIVYDEMRTRFDEQGLKLDTLTTKIDHNTDRLDEHISWHAHDGGRLYPARKRA